MLRERGFVVLAIFAALAITASAQVIHLSANVPFEFTAGGSTLAAGQYTFTPHANLRGGWVITGQGQHTGAVVSAAAAGTKRDNEPPRLVFRRYGNRYFLSEIWTTASKQIYVLPESRPERELVRAMQKPATMIVAAR